MDHDAAPDFSAEDKDVEFIDLDTHARSTTPLRLRLSPRACLYTLLATLLSAILLLALIFSSQLSTLLSVNQFYLLTHRTQLSRTSVANPSPISLQTVANGVVYAIDPDRMVYALHANNGSLLWQRFFANAPWSISDTTSTYTASSSGAITSTRTDTNRELWSRTLPSSVAWPLALANGHLYLLTQKNTLYALNTHDGTVLWQRQLSAFATHGPAAAGDFLFVSTSDGALTAFRGSDGAQLWHKPSVSASQLLATPDSIIFTSDTKLTALHALNGTPLWQQTLSATPVQPLVLANDMLYMASFDQAISALHANNGTRAWSQHLPSLAYESLVVSQQVVYVRTSDTTLYALGTSAGALLWPEPVRDVLSFAAINAIAYVVTAGGKVEAFRGASTTPLWQRQLASPAVRPVLMASGILYTGSTSGTIYAVRASDSALLWHYATQISSHD